MASPREREPEEDGDERYEDVPSGEELEAPKDDPAVVLERLPKLKLGGKGSSKGDKQREKNKNKEKKKYKARRKVESSPQPSNESENGDDDDDEYYAQRLPRRTLKSNTKRSYSSVSFNYDSINLSTNTHINIPANKLPQFDGTNFTKWKHMKREFPVSHYKRSQFLMSH